MEEQLVSLEVAKLLKEKGFGGKSFYHYYYNVDEDKYTVQDNSIHLFIACERGLDTENHLLSECELAYNSENNSHIIAPTQSLAQKWLRDTKKVIFLVDYLVKDEVYLFSILVNNVWYNLHYKAIYEEALEEALKEALKHI